MNILFIDTETNGKPKRYNASMADLDNWPRITQLAWQIAHEGHSVHRDCSHLIKPDGWTIPKERFFIDNNMSTERCEKEGVPLVIVVDTLLQHINEFEIELIVAHNMAFDINVLGAEMIRLQRKPGRKMKQLCTMIHGTDLCKLPAQRGYKWPKLEELYRHLFNKDFEGAHDANADVTACRLCFFEMVRIGAIGWTSTTV
jgi:DNA polymerase-3 subunit epsilon